MKVLKNILIIIVVAALAVIVFIYAQHWENGGVPQEDSVAGGVIINEFMASNKSLLPDEMGEYSDWVELYNPTDAAVDLSGYGLSNDKTEVKWAFPDIMLPAKGYLVVFCSGKGISDADAIYQHTNFKLNASKGGIYLLSDSGKVLDQVEYKDQRKNVSTGRDAADVSQWTAFEHPTPGFSNDEDGYSAFMQSRVSEDAGLLITETMSSNQTTVADNTGGYSDYIEIYNAGDTAVKLEGYGLSDDPEDVLKWKFPDVSVAPGAYLLVFASGKDASGTDIAQNILHTNFRIASYNETVVLSDPMGLAIDKVEVSELGTDFAYARILSESGTYGDEWEQTSLATPGYPNSEAGYSEFEAGNEVALGQVVINEVMISNSLYMPEEDGEYYDWIELFNRGSEAVDLTGYGLTDDAADPTKWVFPKKTLEPGEYITVLASGLADAHGVKKKNISIPTFG